MTTTSAARTASGTSETSETSGAGARAGRAAAPGGTAGPGSSPPTRTAVHLTRRGRLLVVLALVALMLASFAFGRSASRAADQADSGVTPVPLAQLTVQQGDSLWSVARRVAPGRDVREVVDQIRDLNELDEPVLLVGQQLLLPVGAQA